MGVQRQYSEMTGCVHGLEQIARLREIRALRPAVPVAGHARAWWLYAVRAHLPHHTCKLIINILYSFLFSYYIFCS